MLKKYRSTKPNTQRVKSGLPHKSKMVQKMYNYVLCIIMYYYVFYVFFPSELGTFLRVHKSDNRTPFFKKMKNEIRKRKTDLWILNPKSSSLRALSVWNSATEFHAQGPIFFFSKNEFLRPKSVVTVKVVSRAFTSPSFHLSRRLECGLSSTIDSKLMCG